MLKILIAEDEEPIANLIRMNLRRAGYSCVWAPDGEKAADLMDTEKFDLVLLDVMLPGINGYELMEYARSLELPVIFLTALGSTENKVKGLKMGADDYLTKPFEIVVGDPERGARDADHEGVRAFAAAGQEPQHSPVQGDHLREYLGRRVHGSEQDSGSPYPAAEKEAELGQ